jgi:hypothetical protein
VSSKTGELRGNASEAICPHVPVDAVGMLQEAEGVCPRAGATYGDVAGSGALIAGELKHRKGCDWKAVSRLLATLAPIGRGEKGKRYSTDTKRAKALARLIGSGHPSGFCVHRGRRFQGVARWRARALRVRVGGYLGKGRRVAPHI